MKSSEQEEQGKRFGGTPNQEEEKKKKKNRIRTVGGEIEKERERQREREREGGEPMHNAECAQRDYVAVEVCITLLHCPQRLGNRQEASWS